MMPTIDLKISIKHNEERKYPDFDVILSNGDKEPFLSIRGCRIVEGSKGTFLSWPARKIEKTGKWWSHCYASDAFAQSILKLAMETRPVAPPPQRRPAADSDDDLPF